MTHDLEEIVDMSDQKENDRKKEPPIIIEPDDEWVAQVADGFFERYPDMVEFLPEMRPAIDTAAVLAVVTGVPSGFAIENGLKRIGSNWPETDE